MFLRKHCYFALTPLNPPMFLPWKVLPNDQFCKLCPLRLPDGSDFREQWVNQPRVRGFLSIDAKVTYRTACCVICNLSLAHSRWNCHYKYNAFWYSCTSFKPHFTHSNTTKQCTLRLRKRTGKLIVFLFEIWYTNQTRQTVTQLWN